LTAGKPHLAIRRYYEGKLDQHGDTHLGVDWPVAEDVPERYRVMTEVIRESAPEHPIELLDIGCGTSGLLDYLRERKLAPAIRYSGLDVSNKFLDYSRRKFPEITYYELDILDVTVENLPRFDYAVMNGVFTVKHSLTFDQMFEFFRAALLRAFAISRKGIAFNTMSKHVDWERDDLFHMPFDTLAALLTRELSRDFVFRNDYGLYEYTTYVYH
jgi:SAM-dependent methyltransferase